MLSHTKFLISGTFPTLTFSNGFKEINLVLVTRFLGNNV